MGEDFDYAKGFTSLDLVALMTGSQKRCDDGEKKFVQDFIAAWTKGMNLDCFDLA